MPTRATKAKKGPKPTKAKRPKLKPPSTTFVPTGLQKNLVMDQLARGAPPDAIAKAIFYPDSLRLVSFTVFKRAFREELKLGVLGTKARLYNGLMVGVSKGNAACAVTVMDRIVKDERPFDGKRNHGLLSDGTTPSGDPTTTLSLEQLVELRGEVARLVAEVTGQSARRGDVEAQMDPDSEDQAANP